ncbi:MAG TPA: SH3 domain-containing protein [Candidatus Caenarcaniphilales bacterium]|nr:SH3 domain-containing protein [Candidatus Caenarcaniphilales bacterium]
MRQKVRRPGAALAAVLGISLFAAGQIVAPAAAEPRGSGQLSIRQFMTGLACIESGGRYTAVNDRSGAYGKYQIMPRNWPVWARRYLGDRHAPRTPYNQEFVARARIQRLYDQRRSWRRVAYWWLTGRSGADESRWSEKAIGYVDRVMVVARRAASPGHARRVPQRCFPGTFQAPLELPPDRVRVTGGSVFVRREPAYRSRAITVVHRGAVLPMLNSARDSGGRSWVKVVLSSGRTGWLAKRYTHRTYDR